MCYETFLCDRVFQPIELATSNTFLFKDIYTPGCIQKFAPPGCIVKPCVTDCFMFQDVELASYYQYRVFFKNIVPRGTIRSIGTKPCLTDYFRLLTCQVQGCVCRGCEFQFQINLNMNLFLYASMAAHVFFLGRKLVLLPPRRHYTMKVSLSRTVLNCCPMSATSFLNMIHMNTKQIVTPDSGQVWGMFAC